MRTWVYSWIGSLEGSVQWSQYLCVHNTKHRGHKGSQRRPSYKCPTTVSSHAEQGGSSLAKKRRSSIRDFSEFLAVRIVLSILQAMPLSWGYTLARGLAWLAYKIDRRHRVVADQNLQ